MLGEITFNCLQRSLGYFVGRKLKSFVRAELCGDICVCVDGAKISNFLKGKHDPRTDILPGSMITGTVLAQVEV